MRSILPRKLAIEASSICQLKCPSCPRSTEAFQKTIGHGYLKFKDFQNVLEMNPWINEVELSNYGEIFLNPELVDIMKFANLINVSLSADNGVNLNNIAENVIEALVKFNFRSITCSIDGATNDTYKLYRYQGDINNVIENITRINYYKNQYKSNYPALAWQFVILGHNEHEIPMARKMAHDLGMAFYPKLTWDEDFSPIKDPEFVKRETQWEIISRKHYKKHHGVDYMHCTCNMLWDRPQVNWDGKMLGCCRNFWGDFGGNVFQDGLLNCINNAKMHQARCMLLGEKGYLLEDIPCSSCDNFITMRDNGKYLKREFHNDSCKITSHSCTRIKWLEKMKNILQRYLL